VRLSERDDANQLLLAMIFNTFERNGRFQAIRARGGDWRWRRPT
jgi:hypothetical protein